MNNESIATLPNSEYFTLQQLADGVYAAISKEGTGSWANAGIIDLGDQTLIFDTFATPKAAEDLRKAAELLTGRSTCIVINSHDHIDHVQGNQVFADCTIISTPLTRERMASFLPGYHNALRADDRSGLAKMAQQLETEQDALKRHEIETLLGEFTAISNAAESLRPTLPTITFEDQIRLTGTKRQVELITYGGGHSLSDSFLYLREEKIAFMGDLLHIGFHADFRRGNREEWLYILDQVQRLDIETAVPGHGTVGTADDLQNMRDYLIDVQQFAADWATNGGSVEQLNEAAMPEKYAAYKIPSVFYGVVRALVEQHKASI
ncbi:MAG: MBL fold metallo-hydrolase [Tumebacillaceae bacterium]